MLRYFLLQISAINSRHFWPEAFSRLFAILRFHLVFITPYNVYDADHTCSASVAYLSSNFITSYNEVSLVLCKYATLSGLSGAALLTYGLKFITDELWNIETIMLVLTLSSYRTRSPYMRFYGVELGWATLKKQWDRAVLVIQISIVNHNLHINTYSESD